MTTLIWRIASLIFSCCYFSTDGRIIIPLQCSKKWKESMEQENWPCTRKKGGKVLTAVSTIHRPFWPLQYCICGGHENQNHCLCWSFWVSFGFFRFHFPFSKISSLQFNQVQGLFRLKRYFTLLYVNKMHQIGIRA